MDDRELHDHRASAPARRGSARVVRMPPAPEESPLMPEDFDRALRRMKRDLALTALRRQLRDPRLDARSVLALVARIEALQER